MVAMEIQKHSYGACSASGLLFFSSVSQCWIFVCLVFMLQEAGFSYFEMNASDTRSKKSMESYLAEALNNHTLVDFMGLLLASSSSKFGLLEKDDTSLVFGPKGKSRVTSCDFCNVMQGTRGQVQQVVVTTIASSWMK